MRGRRRNGTRMAAGVVLSLGLALGSLPMSGITAAEPDTAELWNTVDVQNVAAEALAEETWTAAETQLAAEALADGAVLDDAENSVDAAAQPAAETLTDGNVPGDAAAAEMAATEFAAAGQGAAAAQDGQDTAEEIVISETDDAEPFAVVDGADAGAGAIEVPEGGGLISEIEIVAIEASEPVEAGGKLEEMSETPDTRSGDCGAVPGTVAWELDEGGMLKVSGNGDMASWESPEQVPWGALRGEILGIEIAEGVTSVGAYAFCGCEAAESVEVAESVSVIGEAAFSRCSGFTTVSIG